MEMKFKLEVITHFTSQVKKFSHKNLECSDVGLLIFKHLTDEGFIRLYSAIALLTCPLLINISNIKYSHMKNNLSVMPKSNL